MKDAIVKRFIKELLPTDYRDIVLTNKQTGTTVSLDETIKYLMANDSKYVDFLNNITELTNDPNKTVAQAFAADFGDDDDDDDDDDDGGDHEDVSAQDILSMVAYKLGSTRSHMVRLMPKDNPVLSFPCLVCGKTNTVIYDDENMKLVFTDNTTCRHTSVIMLDVHEEACNDSDVYQVLTTCSE
ncbi:hypothetical protein [Acinetobacter sp.]|uniref:hypothetical protein n=1 Tax=Acinetobacter sp. TaxID=472 RepID=UPI003CFF8CA3